MRPDSRQARDQQRRERNKDPLWRFAYTRWFKRALRGEATFYSNFN